MAALHLVHTQPVGVVAEKAETRFLADEIDLMGNGFDPGADTTCGSLRLRGGDPRRISSVLMVFRGKILKITKNLAAVRSLHVATWALTGVCIVIHVSFYIMMPLSFGIFLGYFAFGMAVVVWLTGTAFLERVRDSFLFHSSFSTAFIALALLHAVLRVQDFRFAFRTHFGFRDHRYLGEHGYQFSKMRPQKGPMIKEGAFSHEAEPPVPMKVEPCSHESGRTL